MTTHTFSPTRENLLAGLVLSLLLCGTAAVAVAWGQSHPAERFWGWCGGAAAVAGAAFLAYTAALARRRVDLCERGLRYRSVAGTAAVLWEEVDHIRHAVVVDRPNAESVTIRTRDGRSYWFSPNSVGDFHAFFEALQGQAAGHATPAAGGGAAPRPGQFRWRRLTETALRRWWFQAALGGGLVTVALVVFFALDAAERGKAAGPVKLHIILYLLYWAGGKWLAAGLTLAAGLAFVALGAWRRVTESAREVEVV